MELSAVLAINFTTPNLFLLGLLVDDVLSLVLFWNYVSMRKA